MNFLSKVESDVHTAVKTVEGLFTSGKAQAALSEAASFVTLAIPIVQSIDALVPNTTGPNVVAAAQKLLGTAATLQPIVAQAQSNPSGALLALATTLLQKNLPADKSGTALNILNTAVQLAVTAVHA